MFQRRDTFSYNQQSADWSKETRGKELIHPINMNNWLLLFTRRDQRTAASFVQTLIQVAGPMGMAISEPNRYFLLLSQIFSHFN